MLFKKTQGLGIFFGALTLFVDFLFFTGDKLFFFLVGLSLMIAVLPFVVGVTMQSNKEQQIAGMFLEFARNLSESVNTGTPVSKSVMNMRKNNYGALSPYVEKLANQIGLGIPVNTALRNFAYDVDNPVISRAVGLISEAERAGGQIDYILDSVAKSISEIEKLKKERQAAISSLVVQGYIIFFIFIAVMLIMEFKILPLTSNISTFTPGGDTSDLDIAQIESAGLTPEQLARPFLYLLLTQGFFAGFTIGKLSEGSLKAGVKHSFILTIAAFLISTGVEILFAP